MRKWIAVDVLAEINGQPVVQLALAGRMSYMKGKHIVIYMHRPIISGGFTSGEVRVRVDVPIPAQTGRAEEIGLNAARVLMKITSLHLTCEPKPAIDFCFRPMAATKEPNVQRADEPHPVDSALRRTLEHTCLSIGSSMDNVNESSRSTEEVSGTRLA